MKKLDMIIDNYNNNNNIHPARTPIKTVTTQFAVHRSRTVQIVRKQSPLRPAAAKTIHRSQVLHSCMLM